MALYHFTTQPLSRGTRNTVRAAAYRAGCKLYDDRTGQTFDYRNKGVEHVELFLPKDAPGWAVEIQKLVAVDREKGIQAFSDMVESAEKRINSRVWREFEFALHRELTKEQNMALAREFVQDQLCGRGMAALLNFHFDVDKETGEEKPHCHVLVPTRHLDELGMGQKEREWNTKKLLQELRIQWQEYSNFHLKLHGHDIQIDHRCHKDRGIEMEPQPKMGRGVRELEKRLQKLEGEEKGENEKPKPITDKVKTFHDTQLRNLYRVMRRPEDVLEIVTKHHSTFMWADVQKVLHRYVDELPLFQRLEAKLKNSNELMLLKSDPEGQNIYTTRTILKAEKSLVEKAETLGNAMSHGVQRDAIHQAIVRTDQKLKQSGGLSQDQKKAITHLVDEGQLKCVVGIAGAGKTTALGVCQDIWEAEGYAVYGLAPTGKAAQNLEQGGISSTTLHKFLKDFGEGRCQYNPKSVLVLDEAGMVDMERFERLLGAVKQLGVKLIVVGDGAQLQPVEAGPAFRLVTTRLGKSELNTVLRQKEEWQKEATVLFGKQETQAAIREYADKGHVHIVEEKIVDLDVAVKNNDKESVVKLYETSTRMQGLIYREMLRDIQRTQSKENSYQLVKQHQDFERYLEWKEQQKLSTGEILSKGVDYLPFLEARSIDTAKMALLFEGKKLPQEAQGHAAAQTLKKAGLDSLVGIEKQPGQGLEVRSQAKAALIKAWHTQFQENPEKSSLMLAFSNRDVKDLNHSARTLLKESGHIDRREFTYTISKRIEDDFEREYIHKEDKNFAKGDRIVFTRNTKSLGVKNGTMATITDLSQQTVKVRLDEGKEISFTPDLNPYFDQGWAITIHKSQGTTVDSAYLLASYEMTQNLAYVAMTRHREDVQVFGSSLDFWRPEKLPEVLAKSGEKLSPGDYLDADSLSKLMQQDERLLTKICERVGNELEAMGAVSKKAFWQVADHFLGTPREKEIRVNPVFSRDAIREEARAEELLDSKEILKRNEHPSKQNQNQDAAESKAGSEKGRVEPSKTKSEHAVNSSSGEIVFEALTQQCKQRLYAHLGAAKLALTPDLITRVEQQAEKAANFIFHAHTLKGRRPTDKQTEHFLLRAKFELNRISEIREGLTHKWRQMGIHKDELISHIMAERQASIEGRMYLDDKQRGVKPSPNIPDLAIKEIEQNKVAEARLAQDLRTKQKLSESAAAFCAQSIIRHVETHAQKPTSEQIALMVDISRNLEKQDYDPSIGAYTVEYLRRRDGELRFREWVVSNKDLSGFREFPYSSGNYAQPQQSITSSCREQLIPKEEEKVKIHTMDFSL